MKNCLNLRLAQLSAGRLKTGLRTCLRSSFSYSVPKVCLVTKSSKGCDEMNHINELLLGAYIDSIFSWEAK